MGALNFLAQIVGICVAIYIGFTHGAGSGVSLFLVVVVGHFAFTKLSNFLMLIHQRSLSQEQQREILLRAQIEGAAYAAPALWGHIATVCGLAYFCLVGAAIWYFLAR